MLSNNERLDALVQQFSILAGLNYIQSAHMTYQAVSKGMVTEVLTILISIVLFCLRSVQQSETQGVGYQACPSHISLSFHKDDAPKLTDGADAGTGDGLHGAHGNCRHAVYRCPAQRHETSPTCILSTTG